jgi:hypothetical protein
MCLDEASSSPSSKRPQCSTEVVVGSTYTTGPAHAGDAACSGGIDSVTIADGAAAGSATVADGGAGAGGAGAGSAPAGGADADGAGAGGVAASPCFGFAVGCGGSGVTGGRHDEREANTPWYRMAGMRGGGISTHKRAMNSMGVITRWVRSAWGSRSPSRSSPSRWDRGILPTMPRSAAAKAHIATSRPPNEGDRPNLEECLARGREGRDQEALREAVRRYGGDLAAELAAIQEGTHPFQESERRARR